MEARMEKRDLGELSFDALALDDGLYAATQSDMRCGYGYLFFRGDELQLLAHR